MTPATEHFDAIIVGSGFGGAVTACRLAEANMRVCVLERGKAYAPGDFPRSPAQLRGAFWDPSEGLHGLFDVWSFRGLSAIVASGLGGGSLIYANVLLRKDRDWFIERRPDGSTWEWPVSRDDLDPHYDRVEAVLQPTPFPVDVEPYASVHKTSAFVAAAAEAGLSTEHPPLAIAFAAPGQPPRPHQPLGNDNLHGAHRSTCRLCGECDLGCNEGAKQSLDFTYLSRAQAAGAVIRTRTEVRRFQPRGDSGFTVHAVTHSPSREGRPTDTSDPVMCPPATPMTCDRLVLAAGAVGTTHLLLKNQTSLPQCSRKTLGTRFNANGDYLSFARRASAPTAGRERRPRLIDASRGPVITTTVRVEDDAKGMGGFYLQEAGYPAHAAWMLQLVATPRALWGARRSAVRLWWHRRTGRANPSLGALASSLFGDGRTAGGFLPLLGMGREITHGVLTLRGARLHLAWNRRHAGSVFDRINAASHAISDALGASFLADPVLKQRTPTTTVHALGGAPMGRTPDEGFVDPFSRVFGYPRLTVACGAAVPGAVGPNPSLTIAALADRQADAILRAEGRL